MVSMGKVLLLGAVSLQLPSCVEAKPPATPGQPPAAQCPVDQPNPRVEATPRDSSGPGKITKKPTPSKDPDRKDSAKAKTEPKAERPDRAVANSAPPLESPVTFREVEEDFTGRRGWEWILKPSGECVTRAFVNNQATPSELVAWLGPEELAKLSRLVNSQEFRHLPATQGEKLPVNRRMITVSYGELRKTLVLSVAKDFNSVAASRPDDPSIVAFQDVSRIIQRASSAERDRRQDEQRRKASTGAGSSDDRSAIPRHQGGAGASSNRSDVPRETGSDRASEPKPVVPKSSAVPAGGRPDG